MTKQTEKCFGLVVLVPCPYQGHINPMLQLGTALHSYGFSITVVHTIFNSPDPKNHPHFNFVPISQGLSEQGNDYAHLLHNILEINNNCKENFRHFLEKLVINKAHGEKIRCIISDELMFYAEAVAVDLNLPSIILRTTSAATSYARCTLLRFIIQSSVLFEGSDSHDLVPELQPLRFKDLPFSVSKSFGNFAELMAATYGERKSLAIIWNTLKCLEESTLEQIQGQSKVPIFPIGPLHMVVPFNISTSLFSEDRTCISWLDKQPHKSVIYVSSGSLAALAENEAAEMAWGLANSNQPFLWVVRPGSIRGSDWIELLPKGFQDFVGDKGCIVRWAPQREVLAHPAVGAFWSHCGWNSVLESIGEGVPMICKPCFGDQRVNARYVSYVWKIGLELEELERKEIERAVKRLFLDNEGNEMRRRAKELKKEIEDSIRQGKASNNSLTELVNFIMSL